MIDMKSVQIIVLLLLISSISHATVPSFDDWHLELGCAQSLSNRYSSEEYDTIVNSGDIRYIVETRYNYSDRLQFGLQASYYAHDKSLTQSSSTYPGSPLIVHNTQGAALLLCDYLFGGTDLISPYCGVGAGWAFIRKTSSTSSFEEFGSFVINPRIGLEISNHLRIGVEYLLSAGDKDNSFFCIKIGFFL